MCAYIEVHTSSVYSPVGFDKGPPSFFLIEV